MSYNGLSCYLCGDPLDGILCRRCSCGWCGNKLDDGFCSYCASKDGNSFAYDPNPNSFDNSQYFSYQSPQPQFETYSCELCGNDSHYGYNCPSRVPLVYEPEPCYNQNFSDNYYPQNSPSFSQNYLCCAYCGGPHYDYQCQPINETYYELNPSYDSSGFDQPQPPKDFVDSHGILQALNKMQEELEEIKQDRRKKKEDMSIEEMRHEQQLVDYKIKEIMNDLGYKRCRGKKIDEEYERDCEIRIRKPKQDSNEWGSEVPKKEQAYEEEKYSAACRRMLFIPFDDDDDSIPLGDIIARYSTSKAITSDLPIEEPDNSLNMGDEHLDTISVTESDEVIKSSVENLVPIPSEFEGISDDTCDVPNYDNVESDLVESLINRDTSIVYSSKIDPILEEFAGELAHIAPIPPRIDIEYVSFEEVNDVEQEEKEFDLEDILQIQDVILREKLLNVHRLITNIEYLKNNPTPDFVFKSPSSFPILVVDSDLIFEESDTSFSHSGNSLPEFESFSDHTEETRSGSTTTHANYSLPEYDSFLFEIEPDQGGLTSIAMNNNSTNDPLLEAVNSNDSLPEFESFHFDPSFPRPPPKPSDVEICLYFKPNAPVIDNFNELNDDQMGSEIEFSQNVEDDDSFTFVIQTFLPFLIYPEVSPLSCSTRSEDTIFDPDIST
ncbi:hypothetical protein Tco_1331329 [Tanacetum coccineum]